jgi:hypothetical protein
MKTGSASRRARLQFADARWPGSHRPSHPPPGNSAHTALASFKPVALSFLKCYEPFRSIDKVVGHIYGVLTRWVLVGDLAFLAIVRIRL